MNLDDAQKQKISGWIAEGLKLADIQKRISADLGLSLTYMDVRLLVDDLKLVPKDPEPVKVPEPPTPPPAPPAKAAPPVEAPVLTPLGAPEKPAGNVSLSVDQVTRPGTMVSGKVTFSDGIKADWYLDQFGRLGLAAQQQGYKPAPADLQQFQVALERELAKLGY